MWRSLSGFKAKYEDLVLLTVAELDEWKTLVYSPTTTIHGTRQFSEAKAKAHAADIAVRYLQEKRNEPMNGPLEPEWEPTGPDDWLIWRT